MIKFRLNILGQEYHTGDISFSVHDIRRHIISVSPIIGDDKFDHFKGCIIQISPF